ncbi:MAG: MgtC/SapB family protein [Leptospiraceae bacterium]|nr:MgtC/SapB family protein [Leptospiraceae bacterium]
MNHLTLDSLFSIAPYDWYSVLTAMICGTMIGLERQLRGKPIGIRTATLITLGTYVFLASSLLLISDTMDPSRVIGQVITGIGFLGAGVMMSKDGMVIGVTSAATIWMLAAIGVVISLGYQLQAIKFSLITLSVLYGIDLLEENTITFSRGVHARYISRSSRPKETEEREEDNTR